ncbi:hypothetical protein [Pseudomonas fluorescens]|uniref:hypothetical protein n=1 Tax=Pseudomonas fluorescens TaxID=294 RepID=UPI0017841B7C|nr:hypothetical protein [Pseudomonas fluorescens]
MSNNIKAVSTRDYNAVAASAGKSHRPRLKVSAISHRNADEDQQLQKRFGPLPAS